MEDDGGERSSFVAGLIENRAKEVGMAAFDLRSASLHLSQYIETSSSYQNTKTLLRFYDPSVIIVPPNKLAADGMVGVSELVDRCYSTVRKVKFSVPWPMDKSIDCYYQFPSCRLCLPVAVLMTPRLIQELLIVETSIDPCSHGAVLIQNLAAEEPLALGLDTYYKQHYLSLAAAAATIKWCLIPNFLSHYIISFDRGGKGCDSHQPLTDCMCLVIYKSELHGCRSFICISFNISCKMSHCFFLFLGFENTRKSQNMISSIILLKTALDALPILAKLNVRNKSAAGECFIRTETCLEALMDAIREDISALTLLAEVLCLLDMIVNSFAHTISTKPVDRYSRPELTDSGPLAIDAGRHPILESIHNDFVFMLSLPQNKPCPRYTVFATHMDSLAELATIYPNVKVLHFYVDIRDNRLDFKVLSVFLSYEFETLGTAAECCPAGRSVLVVVVTLSTKTTILLSFGGETSEFSVLVHRVADPVDPWIISDGIVCRVYKDNLVVLVGRVLRKPENQTITHLIPYY
ncbi:hypothetical protein [Arabidopsis thaliana]|nr:hypothetical protein [Arabidopsis thaliana]CAB78741.1 hypothetical protein [Arabidopsis thaliana]